ncbi:gp53-like domain-containing protein [Citrobacter europaeus]|uniref:gp53-like domain-containing protein n=2 Tax=Citrobacter TaxID=544 RepID=UPI00397C8AD2
MMPVRAQIRIFLNVGLGEAAKRDVGIGANQIPDMSSFASVRGVTGSQRLPGGRIRQWQQVIVSSGGTCTFPTAFPTALENFSIIHGPGATGPIQVSVATANRSGLQILHNGATNIFTVITEGY